MMRKIKKGDDNKKDNLETILIKIDNSDGKIATLIDKLKKLEKDYKNDNGDSLLRTKDYRVKLEDDLKTLKHSA